MGDLPVMGDLFGTLQRMNCDHVNTKKVTYYFGGPSTWVRVVSTKISTTNATNLLATILGCCFVQPADQIGSTSYDMIGYLISKQNKEQMTCLRTVLDPGTRRTCHILRVPPRSSRAAPASFGCLGALPCPSILSLAQASCILKK